MPKFLGGKVTLTTWELEAESKEDAEAKIAKAENPLTEGTTLEEKTPVKRTVYRLGWFEFDLVDPTPSRNQVLQAFLKLIERLPGKSIIEMPFTDGKISGR